MFYCSYVKNDYPPPLSDSFINVFSQYASHENSQVVTNIMLPDAFIIDIPWKIVKKEKLTRIKKSKHSEPDSVLK